MPPKAKFDLQAPFQPAGDQPRAIAELTRGIESGDRFQTLLGVTGSGKTMTMANVIRNIGKPTLVMSHNKTLAAQLYGELRQFLTALLQQATLCRLVEHLRVVGAPAPVRRRRTGAARSGAPSGMSHHESPV